MKSNHRSILTRTLMTGAASLALLMTGAREGRAESVSVQGADGANAIDNNPDVPATGGESVTATAGSMQRVTDPSNSAFATGGNGGNGGNDPGNGMGQFGGDATATAATAVISGSAEADATAIGGNGGNAGFNGGVAFSNNGNGGNASANSMAVTSGSGDASSSANATGGAMGVGDFGFAGSASAVADAAASGGGKAVATAFATGGRPEAIVLGSSGLANATSNAKTVNGAMADAQSTAIPGGGGSEQGQASSTAKTSFVGASVEATATAPPNFGPPTFGGTATTNAIAQGGSGQAFSNPGETAYAFSTASPNKAYATSLIGGASSVASALLGPRDKVFGTAILGANYASDGGGESETHSASSTFDFGYGGDLKLGLVDSELTGFSFGAGFESMEFTIMADGVKILERSFASLTDAESFFHDNVIDLGSDFGPDIDLTFGYTLVADESGGFGLDLVVGGLGAVPEPSTWAMMLLGFAGLGFAGYRSARRRAGVGLRA